MSLRRWFNAQPIHRKIGVLVLTATSVAFAVALSALMAYEVYRVRDVARADVDSLARILADNVAAAMMFERTEEAMNVLEGISIRPQVRRACLYMADGTLFARVERPAAPPCPQTGPPSSIADGMFAIASVVQRGQPVGAVYVERDLQVIGDRMLAAAFTVSGLLLMASLIGLVISQSLQRRISAPIVELAAVARRFGTDPRREFPPMEAPADEVGDLVRALRDMVRRIRTANEALQASNEALRQEIEERQRIEAEHERLLLREQEANRLKDEFLATVSHELRTPLNAIVGWTRVLMRGRPDEDTLERALTSLHRNANAQARVIDDLIDISRIVKGKLRVRFEPLDLRSVAEASVDVIRPVAEQKGLHLQILQPDVACLVSGDRDRLQQIVWNLLSNAVKFTPTGGTVSVDVEQSATACLVRVRDTGIGIDPAFLPHLFERFRQADASMTREHSGLGIGLAIVHELVELHGGAIEAVSGGRGTGATFEVVLPRIAQAGHAAPAGDSVPEPLPSLEGIRALVVDDNPDSLEMLDAALTGAGASVCVADSGGSALDFWREQPPDILLCDLAMPGMSGYELLEQVRELDSARGRMTPAIAVTAQASDEHVARSIQAGFAAHIAKPYDPTAVIHAVADALTQV